MSQEKTSFGTFRFGFTIKFSPKNHLCLLTHRLDALDGPAERFLLVLDEADGGARQQVRNQDAQVAAPGAEVHHHGGPRGRAQRVTYIQWGEESQSCISDTGSTMYFRYRMILVA